ncbi:MAG TPA: (deoxy)nucleoside triphosphate pyrophosphohydrolase [Polyangia bacterium]|nr:(deoxy)nucleoside triphosphate pyrophosphohydrolase [Polyangia bacterium]
MTRTRLLVVAALIWQDGRVLLSRRRVDQAMPDLWEFPGGKVEAGESPEDALAREVFEELGCRVEVGRIDDVVFHAYPTFDLYMLVYACRLVSGVPRAVAVAQIEWIKPTDLPAMDLLPADFPLAHRLAREAKAS